MKRYDMFLIFLLHIVYGATFTISKILVQYAQPMFTIGIRMILAGMLLLLIARVFEKNKLVYDRFTIMCLAQLSIFGIFLPYTLRYSSLQYLTVAKTAFVYNLSPFISAIFAYFLLRERLSFYKLLGMGIGFSSIVPIFMFSDPGELSSASLFGVSWPEFIMFLSVASFCYSWIVMKKLQQKHHVIFGVNGRTMFAGGMLSLIAAYGTGESCAIVQPTTFFPWLALIILMTNVICFWLYSYLVKHYSITLISLGSLFAPVSAAITSWVYFGESITTSMIIAAVLICIGFAVFYWDELKKLSIDTVYHE